MLIKKLPVHNPPPMMSLHWSVPWPYERSVEKQIDTKEARAKEKKNPRKAVRFTGQYVGPYFLNNATGLEPKGDTARKIFYKEQSIRIWEYEFSVITPENMQLYINGSHKLIPDSVAEEDFLNSVLKGKKKILYQSARVMGCDHYQAMLVCMGIDIFDPKYEVPPLGWYKIRPEYGEYFGCNE